MAPSPMVFLGDKHDGIFVPKSVTKQEADAKRHRRTGAFIDHARTMSYFVIAAAILSTL